MHVELIEDRAIELGGIRTRTEVEDELHQLLVLVQPGEEFASFHPCRELLPLEVRRLVRPGEVVHGHDVLPTCAQ